MSSLTIPLPLLSDVSCDMKILHVDIPLFGLKNHIVDKRTRGNISVLNLCIPQSEEHVVDHIINYRSIYYPDIPLASKNSNEFHA